MEKEEGRPPRQHGGVGRDYAWDGVEMKKESRDNAEMLTKC